MSDSNGACMDCGRRYGDEFGFPDLCVSDADWEELCPSRAPGGLLCPSCMCRRAYRVGRPMRAEFRSGAFAECGQRAPRDAAPAAADLDAFKRDRENEPERTGLPWLRWMLGRLWEKGVRALSVGDVQLANEIAQDLGSPPPAAPQPSEAAKAKNWRAGADMLASAYRNAIQTLSRDAQWAARKDLDAALDEAVALIAAAEQRAESAEADVRETIRLYTNVWVAESDGALTAAECMRRAERSATILRGKVSDAECDAQQAERERDTALRDLAAARAALAKLLAAADRFAVVLGARSSSACTLDEWQQLWNARNEARSAAEAGRQAQEKPNG